MVSTLVVGAGVFALGALVSGFLGELGKDAYALLKTKLIDLFASKDESIDGPERLIILQLFVDYKGHARELNLIVRNPDAEKINWLLSEGLVELERLAPLFMASQTDVAKIVAEYNGVEVIILFGVTMDAVPLEPRGGQKRLPT